MRSGAAVPAALQKDVDDLLNRMRTTGWPLAMRPKNCSRNKTVADKRIYPIWKYILLYLFSNLYIFCGFLWAVYGNLKLCQPYCSCNDDLVLPALTVGLVAQGGSRGDPLQSGRWVREGWLKEHRERGKACAQLGNSVPTAPSWRRQQRIKRWAELSTT